ncbi:hypothetical protein PAXINDRAFT_157324 [Paxillus involutus ATCC 200175]|uniref:Integrase catalytic domain-containing protein n=1 Tax=Paxillus involutus ATCC 200175 TaxID=664439 RepID=A0A0C9TVR2_PAXIN|nr:hypothetical protein PAXINDRAFT_157324 [Paxillus involutus ATCC 200175]
MSTTKTGVYIAKGSNGNGENRAHNTNGHWGRDLVKLKLMDKIWSPKLNQSIVTALLQCPQCKNFGSSHLHSLMYPITHQHPFELLVADYLSLPKGKGRFHNVLLILNTFSQYVWGFKLKVHGTVKTTVDGVKAVTCGFKVPEMFITDGGSHFNNGDLLGRLKRLCSPGLGEDEYENVKVENITKAWPEHFDNAIQQLNERIIPAFQFSPKELLLGIVFNTTCTPLEAANSELQMAEVDIQLAYINQQRLDATDQAVLHATKCKATFNHKVLRSSAGEVIFEEGELVQVYNNTLDMMLTNTHKLLPRWSAPRRIIHRVGNSYQLTTLEGFPVGGLIHARRLRKFIPRDGTMLAELKQVEESKGEDKEEQREYSDTEENKEELADEDAAEEEKGQGRQV